MKTVKLVSISEVKTEKARTDGKISRKYYTAYFMDALNPFAKKQQRNFFEDHANDEGTATIWKSGDPAIVKQFIGKELPGQIVNCEVEPYMINDRSVTSFTTVLLDGERLSTILKQSNRILKPEATVANIKQDIFALPISSSTALNQ